MTDAEVGRLVEGFWHLAAHRSELSSPKDFVRFSWAGGELVAYNDQGSIIAFDNVCPHRGTRFFIDDAGNAPARCPYHGWTYRGGDLRVPVYHQAPDNGHPPRLNRFQTAFCGDFLFVSPKPEHSLEHQLGDLFGRVADISADIAGRSDLSAYDFECDWRVAVENALEADHVDLVHPDTLANLKLGPGRFEYAGVNSVWLTDVTDARTVKGLDAFGRYFDVPHAHRGYTNLFLFPFAMLSSTFGYSYSLQLFLPGRTAGRTHFSSRLLRGRTRVAADHAVVAGLFDSTARLNRQIFEEDHHICRRISPAYDLEAMDRRFGASEERLQRFQAALRDMR
jgi:phenylpropionate dioxygenase-like ring-hydroxylating dioxygenase large terminal subunit